MTFGTLFNDIVIIRPGSDGANQIIRVPIEYSDKEKMYRRIISDPDIDRPYSILLPRMAFKHTNFVYNQANKLNTMNKVVKKIADNSDQLNYQYGPVPWDIHFQLYVYVKNTEDGLKIIEQILPFFPPTFVVTLDLIPEMEETRDIPITLNGVNYEERYEGDLKDRRILIWTLDFTLKGYLYGPVKKTGIIKIANVSFYIANTTPISDSIGNTEVAERLIVTPGLDANGDPVNYSGPYPAITTSISINDIDANSNFGYIETYEAVPIGVPRPIAGANTEQSAQGWEDEGDGS